MATSGPATPAPRRPSLNSGLEAPCGGHWRRVAAIVVASAAGLVAGGCATGPMKLGDPPAVERLSELRFGVSTTKDVIAVLGEPKGKGAVRSTTFGLKESWLYESMEVEGTKARMRMLMVFLDKDTGVYQGHMWMASGMLFGQTK
jgi:hypothetical protein